MMISTNPDAEELDKILQDKPIVNVPNDIWETLYPTWTGLWTDAYGEWDELQASDVFPISDLLSEEREQWFKAALSRYIQKECLEARVEELKACKKILGDLNMERIGSPDFDRSTDRVEQDRRQTASLIDGLITVLEKELQSHE